MNYRQKKKQQSYSKADETALPSILSRKSMKWIH